MIRARTWFSADYDEDDKVGLEVDSAAKLAIAIEGGSF